MSESSTAVVAGHICLDIIPQLKGESADLLEKLLVPGRLTVVGPAVVSTGGAVSNTGLALNRLGIKTHLMGKVGDDVLGRAVTALIEDEGPGLAKRMLVDCSTNTSYSIVLSPPGVDRVFLHSPGANDTFGVDDVDYAVLAGVSLFHFGYPPVMHRMIQDQGAQLEEMYHLAKLEGVVTSLDMALPDTEAGADRVDWRAILTRVLPHVDVFLPSIEELLYMLRPTTYEDLRQRTSGDDFAGHVTPALLSDVGEELLHLGAKVVGLKLGDRGLYVRTAGVARIQRLGRARPTDVKAWADKELWVPCFQADVVGTTGAGDATVAGFLSGLLRDLTPEATATAAVAVGACNVEAADALSGVRSWEETMSRVAAGWEHRWFNIPAADWRRDPRHQLWVKESTS
jgi:sugar/nucleoside kinase (ribokinase family)